MLKLNKENKEVPMNRQEKDLVSKIIKKSKEKGIPWEVKGKKEDLHPHAIGWVGLSWAADCPYTARCDGMELKLYWKLFGGLHLEISRGTTITKLEDGFFDNEIHILSRIVEKLVGKPLMREIKKRQKEKRGTLVTQLNQVID